MSLLRKWLLIAATLMAAATAIVSLSTYFHHGVRTLASAIWGS